MMTTIVVISLIMLAIIFAARNRLATLLGVRPDTVVRTCLMLFFSLVVITGVHKCSAAPATTSRGTGTGTANWDWMIYIGVGLIILFHGVTRSLGHEAATGKKSVSLISVCWALIFISAGLARMSGYQIWNHLSFSSVSSSSFLGKLFASMPFGPELWFLALVALLILLIRPKTAGYLQQAVDILTIVFIILAGVSYLVLAGNHIAYSIIPVFGNIWNAIFQFPIGREIMLGLVALALSLGCFIWLKERKVISTIIGMFFFLLALGFLFHGVSSYVQVPFSGGLSMDTGRPGQVISQWWNNLWYSWETDAERERRQNEINRRNLISPPPSTTPPAAQQTYSTPPAPRTCPPREVRERPAPPSHDDLERARRASLEERFQPRQDQRMKRLETYPPRW